MFTGPTLALVLIFPQTIRAAVAPQLVLVEHVAAKRTRGLVPIGFGVAHRMSDSHVQGAARPRGTTNMAQHLAQNVRSCPRRGSPSLDIVTTGGSTGSSFFLLRLPGIGFLALDARMAATLWA